MDRLDTCHHVVKVEYEMPTPNRSAAMSNAEMCGYICMALHRRFDDDTMPSKGELHELKGGYWESNRGPRRVY